MRPVHILFILFAAGIAISASVPTPVSAEAINHCTRIESREGWKRIELPAGVFQNARAEGTWSVDAANYEPVEHTGHYGEDAEKLAPYNSYKYTDKEKFGALLIRAASGDVMSFDMMQQYIRYWWYWGNPTGTGTIEARINDSDRTLHDNAGYMNLCFTILDDFKPKGP